MNNESNSENVHHCFVNAERGDGGLPEYFRSRIDNNTQNALLQEAVFRELWYSNDSIHSLGSLSSSFEASRQTVASRLDEMVEQGILRKGSVNNGDYWWIRFPESDYPLPKDVVVHSESEEEMSISEFLGQLHVQIAVPTLLATIFGGIIVVAGAFGLTGNSIIPISGTDLISTGLLTCSCEVHCW
ncbi:MAG: hypothetical protein U5K28_00130 [Halobacteriales archaeon]|nr:hypothetical protein [Halobacteriales archaeon]